MMEWSDDKILQLIAHYERNPILWNPQHVNYKLNNRKYEAWNSISDSMNVSVSELKKKMASLMASYRRERSKVLKRSYGEANENVTDDSNRYDSKWFAYKAFSFLNDVYRPKLTLNPDQVVDNGDFMEFDYSGIIKSEIHEPEELEVCYTAQDESSSMLGLLPTQEELTAANNEAMCTDRQESASQKKRTVNKRKYRNYDSRVTAAVCKLAKKIGEDHNSRDECKVYGEYITHKLRNYDFCTRSIVQYQINKIIFDADMGKYLQNQTNSTTIPIISGSKETNNFELSDITSFTENNTELPCDKDASKTTSDGKHFLDS